MERTIYISVLLKDNKIVGWHVGRNERKTPSDYYKDFIYANETIENCDEIYQIEKIAVTFEDNDDKKSNEINELIFGKIARTFFRKWEIHPKHWGTPAY